MNVQIRTEACADVPKIAAVTAAAFLNAPHTSNTEQYIIDALRRAGGLALSLVADVEDTVVGHVAISPVSISDGTTGWFGLGPISVVPENQRSGVGSQLAREALRILCERGAGGCVVLGEPRFYGRFGFRVDPELVLSGVPPGYFQVKACHSSRPRGVVTYHDAFDV